MRALEDEHLLRTLLRQYGAHSLAYSALQPGMRYWGDPAAGFAAYRKNTGRYTFLGDPICAPSARAAVLEQTANAFPGALFMQIQQATAELLRPMGYRITPVGVENEIDTQDFSLAGKRMADLRHYRNKARKGGVCVVEEEDTMELRKRLRPVSDAWLPSKSFFSRELEFLARPYGMQPEPDVRIFTGAIDGQAVAFVILDPIYGREGITGYTVTILRHHPRAPEGSVDYIVLHVIEQLSMEGIPRLSLGVSPFHHIEALADRFGTGSRSVYWLYRALRRWGNPIYHFRGLSFHKSRYRAREVPVFTAVPSTHALWAVFAASRACRML